MVVCSLLAVNIYITRKKNTDVAKQLVETDEEAIALNEKKIVCENDLKSQEGTLKELSEALEMRKKENEEAQKRLDVCTEDLKAKKAEKEAQAQTQLNDTKSEQEIGVAVKYL